MALLEIPIFAFATGQFSGNPPNSGILVQARPFEDFVLSQGADPDVARLLLEFNDSDVTQVDVDEDGVLEDVIGQNNNPRIQSFSIDLDGDGVADFDVIGQNPNTLDVFTDGQEGDNIARLNGQIAVVPVGSTNFGDQIFTVSSQNLFIANNAPFPEAGQTLPIVDQGSGVFGIGDPNDTLFPCFVAGTLIETATGLRPVEEIMPGDQVVTRDHGLQTVIWVGTRTYAAAALKAAPRLRPVRFEAGAIGNLRPLCVSRQHRMLVTGLGPELLFGQQEALAPALSLVNGNTITLDDVSEVTYVHLLFDRHEIIFAEGAATESFYPAETIMTQSDAATRAELLEIMPQLADLDQIRPLARPGLVAYEGRALTGWLQRNKPTGPL